MSYIAIHVYDGDSEEYRDGEHEASTVGARIDGDERCFTDGEELDAAQDIIGLLSDGKHFDARQWRN